MVLAESFTMNKGACPIDRLLETIGMAVWLYDSKARIPDFGMIATHDTLCEGTRDLIGVCANKSGWLFQGAAD